jgi:ABC-type transport system involved in cytochrome c biogenesis permease subunit
MPDDLTVVIMASAYGLAMIVSSLKLFSRRRIFDQVGLGLLATAFLLNSWAIIDRWIEGGQPPLRTMYETMVFYPWCVALLTLALIGLYRLYFLAPFAAGIALPGLLYIILFRPETGIANLPPALRSVWFIPHVATYFVAYAALFVSFVLACLALGRGRGAASGTDYESYAHQSAVFGICAMTFGLTMGAIWGQVAWGNYWSWDPKENWALVTWLAYMIYLHLRLIAGWRERKAMWILVFAFAAVVFTYLGMKLLPTAIGSLHAYQ